MKRIALALIACAGLGFAAGRQPEPDVVPDNHKPTVAAPLETDKTPAIETPLVEKLLPKKPDHIVEPNKLVDGQLSPRKQWKWSERQWAWVPVKQAGPSWVQDGHSATVDHLIREHGYTRPALAKLTQQQLDTLHSNAHNAARAAAPVRSSGCPGGNCPAPSRGGLFRRR